MGKGTSISVHHVTRVEGHGNIVVDLRDGTLQRCELQIVESPRFFEALLKDRPHDEAPRITCRICGICSVGHATASIQAVEAALGIAPGPKTRTLRRLNMCGEWLQSHVLHAYFLVAPDLFQAPSVVPLASSHPEIVKRALRLKALANEICYAIGGRHVMPISYLPGAMGHWPSPAVLETLRARLLAARPDIEATVELFATIEWPAFEQEIEALAAFDEDGSYPMMGGPIHSSRGPVYAPGAYREASAEHLVEHSAAKHTRGASGPVRVGALARYQLAHARLGPAAKKAAAALKLSPDGCNPFHTTLAQVVEAVQAWDEAVALCEQLLADPAPEERAPVTRPRGGVGVGLAEVPRGTLIHDYEVGSDGRIVRANCVIPTGQNLAAIEADMRAFVPGLVDRPKEQITRLMEMLVRAYDPCISCAVHLLDVRFVGDDRQGASAGRDAPAAGGP
jgi:coenzyme F420-reducing hydrogenase alpha subunit